MYSISQGNIIKIEKIKFPALVVSKNFFNEAGQAIVCPVVKDIAADALHIPIQTEELSGIVMCEQLKFVDLRMRGYKKISELRLDDVMNITDAIQSIFDYFPFANL